MRYYGTETQQRLQRACDEAQAMIAATPGLVQAGQFFSVDDFDRIDWTFVSDHLASDGVFGFRMMPTGRIEDIRERLGSDFRLDTWNVFRASRDPAITACRAILEGSLPGGLVPIDPSGDAGDDTIGLIQTCMAENGIVPFSSAALLGRVVPAVTIGLADASGRIVATAHANMSFSDHSKYRSTAWVGLIAVTAQQRGRGVGRYVNALAITAAVNVLGADTVVEFVRADNTPSRRMIESCGLRLDPALLCGLATPAANARFTV